MTAKPSDQTPKPMTRTADSPSASWYPAGVPAPTARSVTPKSATSAYAMTLQKTQEEEQAGTLKDHRDERKRIRVGLFCCSRQPEVEWRYGHQHREAQHQEQADLTRQLRCGSCHAGDREHPAAEQDGHHRQCIKGEQTQTASLRGILHCRQDQDCSHRSQLKEHGGEDERLNKEGSGH